MDETADNKLKVFLSCKFGKCIANIISDNGTHAVQIQGLPLCDDSHPPEVKDDEKSYINVK